MDGLFEAWNLAIMALIAVAIVIHFVARRTAMERLHLIVIVAGFFATLYIFQDNWFVAQTFIVIWVILSGARLIISRNVLIAMLAIVLLLSFSSPVFYFAAVIFYTIVVGGFILSSLKEIRGLEAESQWQMD